MTELEIQRIVRHRLAVIRHAQEISHNVQKTCRYYGVSRSWYYKWLERYNREGEVGLRDRSKAPITRPWATSDEVVAKVLYLRQHYHFGPQKISMYLARYHDVEVSGSGVWRILKRAGLNRLPRSQRYQPHAKRWKRYEMPQPGHQVQ
ncbi:MAG TPA: helix-turn-helix domain-containing protein, partial [Acidimicrobiales bacterium]